ncbi:MAG: septum formation initiator family protein [Clostridia bacterium]|nr:septum formation initiator family protein [Clostridia bacterium]MBQ2347207.1 septum formation initiator family protein [Clostridia bacterium]
MKSRSNKRKKTKDNKKMISFIISIAVILFAFYAVVTLVDQQLKIADKKEELAELQNEIIIQEVKNDELNDVYNLEDSDNDAYIERVAREEFDYSKQGERVFINIAGE